MQTSGLRFVLWVRWLILGLAVAVCASAHAAYPERPIVLVVPFAAGGGSDIVARTVARSMSDIAGLNIVVENRPGAGGNIASAAVAKARPDGYTILFMSTATHGINPSIYPNAGYDPIKDFTVIGQIGQGAMVLFAHAALPASNLRELVALVRQNPGKYAYGSPGSGTPHHLAMEQLKLKAGLSMAHVPYRGAGPGMADLAAGHIPLMIGGFGPAAAFITQGKIKVIGSSNLSRLQSTKEVPLFSETVPGVGVGSWAGLAAPAGTPPEAIGVLGAALARALADGEVRQQLARIGVDVDYQAAEPFARMIANQLPVWKELVQLSGAKAD